MTATPPYEPAAFLQERLAQASPDVLRELLTTFVYTLLSADAEPVCGAAHGAAARSSAKQRNGSRATGLRHPRRHRGGHNPQVPNRSYFPQWRLKRRRLAESALISVAEPATC